MSNRRRSLMQVGGGGSDIEYVVLHNSCVVHTNFTKTDPYSVEVKMYLPYHNSNSHRTIFSDAYGMCVIQLHADGYLINERMTSPNVSIRYTENTNSGKNDFYKTGYYTFLMKSWESRGYGSYYSYGIDNFNPNLERAYSNSQNTASYLDLSPTKLFTNRRQTTNYLDDGSKFYDLIIKDKNGNIIHHYVPKLINGEACIYDEIEKEVLDVVQGYLDTK